MSSTSKIVALLTIFLFLSAFGTSGQEVIFPFQNLENNEFSFRITQSADYTNYLDDSILVTVVGNQEQSFSIRNSGENSSEGVWLSGIEQYSVENTVQLGPLYQSGFEASSQGEKSAFVRPFNHTFPLSSNMNSTVNLDNAPFIHPDHTNATFGNDTLISPFITIDPVYFITEIEPFMVSNAQIVSEYLSNNSESLSLDTRVFQEEQSFEYRVDGTMPDFHHFTYYPTDNFTSIDNFNEIEIEGGIYIEFGDDKVLNDFSISYLIIYDDTRIMNYDFSISVRTGSGGNINIGDTGFQPGWEFFTLIAALIVLPTLYMYWKRQQKF